MKSNMFNKGNRLAQFTYALLLGVSLTFLGASAFGDINKDTPEDVMKAGRNGSEGLAAIAAAVRDAQAISAHLERDRGFATRVLELAKRNDKRGLAALFKADAPTGEVQVLEIKDFTVKVSVTVKGHTVTVCVSNDGGCDGKNFGAGLT